MAAIVVAPRRRFAAMLLGAAVLALHLAWWPVAEQPPVVRTVAGVQVRTLPLPPAPPPPLPERPAQLPSPPHASADAASDRRPHVTKLAPAFAVEVEVSGRTQGPAQLLWRPTDDGRYELRLVGARLDWTSRGRVDATGIAPEHYEVRPVGRAARSVRFEEGHGGQDGLSWLLQLAAIVDADPARFTRGERISLHVSGSRGQAGVWHFQVQGVEDTLLKLLHEPARLAEPRAEVWLDPARSHLPARVRVGWGGAVSWELVIPRLENCVEGSICRR